MIYIHNNKSNICHTIHGPMLQAFNLWRVTSGKLLQWRMSGRLLHLNYVPNNFDHNWIKYSDDLGVRQNLLLDRREKEDARATPTVRPDSLVPQVQLDGIVTI